MWADWCENVMRIALRPQKPAAAGIVWGLHIEVQRNLDSHSKPISYTFGSNIRTNRIGYEQTSDNQVTVVLRNFMIMLTDWCDTLKCQRNVGKIDEVLP